MHKVTIVVIIGIILFILLSYDFFVGLPRGIEESPKIRCNVKLFRYCAEWNKIDFGDKPYNWDDVDPKICDEIGIYEPSVDECKELLGISIE